MSWIPAAEPVAEAPNAMRDFYITLPSNTRGKDAANTTADFRVLLPNEIQLNGDWEVGIVEVIYPNSWFNVNDEPSAGGFVSKSNEIVMIRAPKQGYRITIPANHYSSIGQLLGAIKRAQTTTKADPFEFSLDENSGRVKYDAPNVATVVVLPPLLQYMLGFEAYGVRKGTVARYPPDLRGGIDALFVYSDIVEPQIVGDTKAPILRIIPVSGSFTDIVDRVFVAPHYVPVLNKQFSSVRITIKTDQDRLVPFQFGKVIVKLHNFH